MSGPLAEVRTAVGAVSAQTSPAESVAVLGLALERLEAVLDSVDAAIAKVVDTQQLTAAVLQGGQPGPMLARLHSIRESSLAMIQQAALVRQRMEAALAQARQLGDAGESVAGGGDAGQPPEPSTHSSGSDVAVPEAVPQGLTAEQFRAAVDTLRTGTAHIEGELFVHGSRVAGTARPGSDIDFGVRVSSDRFDQLISERLGRPNPGSAKERTMQWAIRTGKIQSGEAGLSRVRRRVEAELDMDVDLSIVRKGGPFDTPPSMEVPRD